MTIIIPKPANTALQPDMTLTNEPEIETKIGPLLFDPDTQPERETKNLTKIRF